MAYLKIFIAGLALPSVLLPIGLYIALLAGKPELMMVPFLHAIPLVWGIWNVLYFVFFKNNLPGSLNCRLWLTGAVLGLLVAAWGIFCIHLPMLLGISDARQFLPLVVVPIVYAILWRYVVKPINDLVGLSDQ
jgi:hypothetical protein